MMRLADKQTENLMSESDRRKLEQKRNNRTVNTIYIVAVVLLVISGLFAFNFFNDMYHFI